MGDRKYVMGKPEYDTSQMLPFKNIELRAEHEFGHY
jgi:hypothetical protein